MNNVTNDTNTSEKWFVQKQESGNCLVVSERNCQDSSLETWGAFNSQSEAIARRVGLIRAGKCQPIIN